MEQMIRGTKGVHSRSLTRVRSVKPDVADLLLSQWQPATVERRASVTDTGSKGVRSSSASTRTAVCKFCIDADCGACETRLRTNRDVAMPLSLSGYAAHSVICNAARTAGCRHANTFQGQRPQEESAHDVLFTTGATCPIQPNL